jgi:molybdenum cofactor biosynthesis protein B
MSVDEHRRGGPASLRCGVVTVSDTRDERTDRGGPLLAERAERAGHRVTRRTLARDDAAAIRAAVRELVESVEVDVILVTGGTGVSPRDVTVEAVAPLFDKELPGFGELFRALSFAEIGAAAMLSRATAGVARGKAVFLLPGSPPALELAMAKLILPELAHLVGQARRPG